MVINQRTKALCQLRKIAKRISKYGAKDFLTFHFANKRPAISPSTISKMRDVLSISVSTARIIAAAAHPNYLFYRELVIKTVARAADGANRVFGPAAIDRLAQATDMNINGAFVHIDVMAPDTVQ